MIAMKPYYEAHGIALYVADCRDVLPTLPQGRDGAHLLLTDPPYGVSATASGHRKSQLAMSSIANDKDTVVANEGIAAAWSALRFGRHAYVFGPFNLTAFHNAAGCCELIWDKCHLGMGDLASPWGPAHEPIQFAKRVDGAAMTRRGSGGGLARARRGSVLRHPRQNASGAKFHIADKPVPLLRELIEMSSRHGETVLDPFAGSGSTLLAAMIEGRKAIGIELEEPWAEVAAKRLDEATRQGALFCDAYPGGAP
jgi:DNA modification methylase